MTKNFEPVWKEYSGKLHGFIMNRVNDRSSADDILQDVFLRIYSKMDALKDENKLQSWMYRITRNAIIDYYRSRKKNDALPVSLPAPETENNEQIRRELTHCMLPMINSLPDKYKEAVIMSEIEGLTQQEVADKQEISLSGAKSRVQRGRGMIKKLLGQCCRFAFDQRGNIVDYQSVQGVQGKKNNCGKC